MWHCPLMACVARPALHRAWHRAGRFGPASCHDELLKRARPLARFCFALVLRIRKRTVVLSLCHMPTLA